MHSGPPPHQQVALRCLGFICEEVPPQVLQFQSNNILNLVITAIDNHVTVECVKEAAHALFSALDCLKKHFLQAAERTAIIDSVCSLFAATVPDIRIRAYEILTKIVGLYYPLLEQYMGRFFELTMTDLLKPVNDDYVMMSIEFWATACDIELEIKDKKQYSETILIKPTDLVPPHQPPPPVRSLNLIPKVFPNMFKQLVIILVNKPPTYNNEEWNKFMAAANILKIMAQLLGKDVYDKCYPLVTRYFTDQNWQHRNGAIQLLGCIIEAPRKVVQTAIQQSLPSLLNICLKDPSPICRETASWTIQSIATTHAKVICNNQQLYQKTFETMYHLLTQKEILYLRKNACTVYAALFKQSEKYKTRAMNSLSTYFPTLFDLFLNVMFETDNDPRLFQLRLNCMSAFTQLIDNCAAGLQTTLIEKLSTMLQQLRQRTDRLPPPHSKQELDSRQERLADYLTIIASIAHRLEVRISQLAEQIFYFIFLLRQAPDPNVQLDVIMCLEAMVLAMQPLFIDHLQPFKDYIINMIICPPSDKLCRIAIGIVSDIARGVENLFDDHLPPFMEAILNKFEGKIPNNRFPPSLHAELFITLGDLVMSTTAGAAYLPRILNIVYNGLHANFEPRDRQLNPPKVDYIMRMHTAILNCLSCIFQSFRSHPQPQFNCRPLVTTAISYITMRLKDAITDCPRFKEFCSMPTTQLQQRNPQQFEFKIQDLMHTLPFALIRNMVDLLGDMIQSVGAQTRDLFRTDPLIYRFILACYNIKKETGDDTEIDPDNVSSLHSSGKRGKLQYTEVILQAEQQQQQPYVQDYNSNGNYYPY